jgi:nicotinic acid mononucleotide adenylyltransferase
MQFIQNLLLIIFLWNTSSSSYHISALAFTINNIPSGPLHIKTHLRNTETNHMIRSYITLHKMSQNIVRTSTSKLSSVASSIHPDDAPTTDLSKSIIAAKLHKLSFAIAGGGSKAISSLVSTPGASSVLLNGSVLYDRNSYCQYISQHVSNMNSVENYQSRDGQFGFASRGSAVLLSQAALHHAFQQSCIADMTKKTLAVGCTSTLVSHGREDRNSRAHISLVSGDGRGVIWDVLMSKEESNYGADRRTRAEEEDLLAQLILSSVQQYSSVEDIVFDANDMLDRNGDELNIFTFQSNTSIQDVAQTVIDESEKMDVAVVAPQQESTSGCMIPLAHTVIPFDPIIFPGSFNPPHIGHIQLANAALKTMTRKKKEELEKYFQPKNSNAPNVIEAMWNTSEYQTFKAITDDNLEEGPFSVLFEMSLTNADKPPLEATEASRRVELFGQLALEQDTAALIPKDWGVLLTSAPLFIDKLRVIKKYLVPSGATLMTGNKRQITFVIGTDTMVRIINPKYYGNDNHNMLAAVREMGNEGVHFVVGGRLEQIKEADGEIKEAQFVTGEEELEGLPEDIQNMFTIIREDDFRVDISSTELRAKMSETGAGH